MMLLEHLKEKKTISLACEPIFFALKRSEDCQKLETYLAEGRIQHIIDDYDEQLKEWFAVEHPHLVFSPDFAHLFQEFVSNLKKEQTLAEHGQWVFFPWRSTLVHILDEEAFFAVRTARNQNLISSEEQKKYYNGVVGIAGLSVGNSVALALVLQGGCKHIRLADFDQLALTNLNRIRGSLADLGSAKVEMTARQIYEINPYAQIDIFRTGLTEENIDEFFTKTPRLDVVVDEIDSLAIKYLIRERAKKYAIPVVMAADNGDDGVVDIERYDSDPDTTYFHGQMGEVSYESLKGLHKLEIGKKIVQFIGIGTIAERVKTSMPEIGKTIVSWPQLGGAALLNGSALAYCVRKILNKQPIVNGRAIVSLEEALVPGYNSEEHIKEREHSALIFKNIFGI